MVHPSFVEGWDSTVVSSLDFSSLIAQPVADDSNGMGSLRTHFSQKTREMGHPVLRTDEDARATPEHKVPRLRVPIRQRIGILRSG